MPQGGRGKAQQEILVSNDFQTLVILWGVVKFDDTMQFDVLGKECEANGYGKRKTAISMMVHAAPRILKMGKAVGGYDLLDGQRHSSRVQAKSIHGEVLHE